MTETSATTPRQPSGISRRRVAQGVAWTVPAVIVAGAAPAMATSGPPPVITFGTACKLPGGSACVKFGYSFPVSIYNPSSETIYVGGTGTDKITLLGAPSGWDFDFSTPSEPITILPGQTVDVRWTMHSNSSANTAFCVTFVVPWGHNDPVSDDPNHHAPLEKEACYATTAPDCPLSVCG